MLRRIARGERRRAIPRVTGHSRSSIRRWVRAARRLGWQPGGAEPDEALARGRGGARAPGAGGARAGRERGAAGAAARHFRPRTGSRFEIPAELNRSSRACLALAGWRLGGRRCDSFLEAETTQVRPPQSGAWRAELNSERRFPGERRPGAPESLPWNRSQSQRSEAGTAGALRPGVPGGEPADGPGRDRPEPDPGVRA